MQALKDWKFFILMVYLLYENVIMCITVIVGIFVFVSPGSRFIHPVPTDHQIRLQNLLPTLEVGLINN